VSAQEELLRTHAGLIAMIARYYMRMAGAMELEDLLQEGRIGLLTAIGKFDPSRGTRLTTVAYQWIRQAIRRAIDRKAEMIRAPSYAKAQGRSVQVLSLDVPVGDYEVTFLGELIPAEGDLEEDTVQRLTAPELPEDVAAALEALTDWQRTILIMRYGLYGGEPCRQGQIAARLGISKQNASVMEIRAMRALRRHLGVPEPEDEAQRAADAADDGEQGRLDV